MKKFTTPEGLEFPLLDLKGKDYLQVQWRVSWFRYKYPLGQILTERISESDKHVTYRATIAVPDGTNYLKIANADKTVFIKNSMDYEKAETGAIGRALALSGFGTANAAEDLDEGEQLADAPLAKATALVNDQHLEWLCKQSFPEKSKFPNKTFEDVVTNSPVAAQNYHQWILRQEKEDWSKLAEFQKNFKKFYELVHEGQ